jgi:hypothetical protein
MSDCNRLPTCLVLDPEISTPLTQNPDSDLSLEIFESNPLHQKSLNRSSVVPAPRRTFVSIFGVTTEIRTGRPNTRHTLITENDREPKLHHPMNRIFLKI